MGAAVRLTPFGAVIFRRGPFRAGLVARPGGRGGHGWLLVLAALWLVHSCGPAHGHVEPSAQTERQKTEPGGTGATTGAKLVTTMTNILQDRKRRGG
jgi:hypothetical protein